MAKTTAPLLSFGGSGQIAKTQVYSKWRGINYVRRYTIPANPDTTQQQHTRGVFSWLTNTWKFLDGNVQGVWTAFSKGKPFTDRNAWIKANLQALRGVGLSYVTTLNALVTSPGVNGGFIASAIGATDGGTHHIAATLTAPTLPADWTITKAHWVAVAQGDAHSDVNYTSYYASDDTSTYGVSMLVPAGTYVLTGFFEYVNANGLTAYGPSIAAAPVVIA